MAVVQNMVQKQLHSSSVYSECCYRVGTAKLDTNNE